jgi:coenzyme F420-reducing hydrogenase beta subunit
MADGILYSKHHLKDPFFYGFLVDLYLNRICYECPFSTLPRQGDITLGDFWGVPEKYKDERGVSVILVNSEKGMSVLNELLKKKRIFAEEVPLEWATKNNPRIITGQMKVPEKREEILKNIHTKNWKYIERKYIKPPTGMRGLIRKGINLFKRILKKTLKIKR